MTNPPYSFPIKQQSYVFSCKKTPYWLEKWMPRHLSYPIHSWEFRSEIASLPVPFGRLLLCLFRLEGCFFACSVWKVEIRWILLLCLFRLEGRNKMNIASLPVPFWKVEIRKRLFPRLSVKYHLIQKNASQVIRWGQDLNLQSLGPGLDESTNSSTLLLLFPLYLSFTIPTPRSLFLFCLLLAWPVCLSVCLSVSNQRLVS